jgi:cytochrome P450
MKPYDLPFPLTHPDPGHAVAAVSHADPYAYYDQLAARRGWHFDAGLQMWVAASAASVDEVMAHPCCHAPAAADDATAFAAGVNAEQARALALLIGRRLWRRDKLAPWMVCVPELTMVSLAGAGHAALPALAYEAATALIGNGVLALLREPEEERCGPEDADALVHAVSRFDPPVQNTRRVVMRDCEIGGARLKTGQEVLLVLAAASRDLRGGRPYGLGHGLGQGAAECPHYALACAIAAGALEALMSAMRAQHKALSLQTWLQQLAWTYRDSSNVRMPLFSHRA